MVVSTLTNVRRGLFAAPRSLKQEILSAACSTVVAAFPSIHSNHPPCLVLDEKSGSTSSSLSLRQWLDYRYRQDSSEDAYHHLLQIPAKGNLGNQRKFQGTTALYRSSSVLSEVTDPKQAYAERDAYPGHVTIPIHLGGCGENTRPHL